ncbi:MAG: LPS export ABC transporter periplasmic protein LptC [Burkholderiales bacterium PBB4]|nr:MAG: LPS export ABC transporter periplasmic protein LptC [Burkholderiales bacterium PBB4]
MLKHAWDRFVLYIPLLMMGGLALTTYWLVHTTPPVGAPAGAAPVTHEADYFMQGFSLRTFDVQGRVRTEVSGERARHFPDTKWLEIDAIRIKSYDDKGRLTIATASRGLTNEDSSEVQLLGNAVVVRDSLVSEDGSSLPRMEYRGEFLHAFMTSERVVSHKPVELFRGKDKFSADTLDYDNVEQLIQLRGRVRGVLFASP